MHKIKLLTAFLAIIFIVSIYDPHTSLAATKTKAAYTVLVYLNGSDLESEGAAATADLKEMMAIGSQKNINIVVETGGTKKWYTKNISNKVNQRWLVQKGKLQLLKTLNKRNMGDPNTLKDFLTWGVKTYPANRYAVVFWDHGGGSVSGFGVDELFNSDSLTLPELEKALKGAKQQTGKTMDLVGFDACLMSTIETANILNPYAKYLVASQELEPGHGWDYKAIIKSITYNPQMTGDQLGKAIANGFMGQAKTYGTDEQITAAVTNLSKIPNVVTAVNALSSNASTNLSSSDQLISFGQARAKSREFSDTGMVDLADFAKYVSTDYPELADNLQKAIQQAVVYQVVSRPYADVKGLSIYFPLNNKSTEDIDRYKQIAFSSAYQNLLTSYYSYNDNQTAVAFDPNFQRTEGGNSSDKIFEVKVADKDISRIANVYSVIGQYVDNRFYFLGIDNDVNFNRETGIISDNFSNSILTLEDSYISIFFDHETDEFARYTIPALLNGQEVQLIVLYDFTNTDDAGYAEAQIIGAWPGVDENTGLAARDLIQFEYGDEIVPLLTYYDYTTEKFGYEEGDPITVDKNPELFVNDLPAGDYVYGFYAEDYFGNTTQSELYDVTID